MNSSDTLYQCAPAGLTLRGRGKVRDIFDLSPDLMLIVTTDRISAFDCILPDPIPAKGRVLTAVSNFWFEKLSHVVPNHLSGRSLAEMLPDPADAEALEGRALVVKKLKPLPVEAVVRGYLIGSGWKDYQASGAVCGIALPQGLRQAERLPAPIFTPSTKAELGTHDENISYAQTVDLIGEGLARQVSETSLKLYTEAAAYALERGIIIADTKFEFGLDGEGRLHLIDEVLTPDSSRFWPVDQYQVGISPPSFDKQFVRDYLESLVWDKQPPAPNLPPEIIAKTAEKYREAQTRLTGT
jgi:phosphoribosylaminoimidazole-succinocarboxamide synthase